jgi:hypothetical protein
VIFVDIFIGIVLVLLVIFHIFWVSRWAKEIIEPRPSRPRRYFKQETPKHHGDYPYLDK